MAIPAILAFIARMGVAKAITKYGAKAVREAQKHAKDMVTKKTPGQKQSAQATRGQRTNRETARRSAAVGVAVGVAGTKATQNAGGTSNRQKAQGQRVQPKDFPKYKGNSQSAKAFRDMYRQAKQAGYKSFTFEGRRYKVEDK
jgi:hypothetical protein